MAKKTTLEEMKVILSLTVQALREVSQQAFYAHEMAWRMYGGLMKLDADFPQKYSAALPDLSALIRSRDDIAATLSEIEQRLR